MTNIIELDAKKAKSGEAYSFPVGKSHWFVLQALEIMGELSDRELTFLLELHMVAPRRCELRDAGMVERAGLKAGHMTWRITDAGRELGKRIYSSIDGPTAVVLA